MAPASIRWRTDEQAEGANDDRAPDRYTLHATVDGYVIREYGVRICTFHGAQYDLASATLKRLLSDEISDNTTNAARRLAVLDGRL